MTIASISKNGKSIRLTDERWAHITEEHSELAGLRMEVVQTIENPERVLLGKEGERLALREIETGKFIVVVYREFENDGFIITAFVTRRRASFDRRTQIWPV